MFDQNYILNKYLIKEVKPDEEWNFFNNKSRNKSIFCDIDFISLEKNKKNFFSIYKNKECVAKFFLLLTNEKKIVLPDELIFTPIIYRKISNQTQSSLITEKNEILGSFAYYILKNFDEAKFCLDYVSNDLRPFEWINFIEGKKLFSICQVKYTQIINLKNINSDKISDMSLFKNFSSRIKQSIKYSEEESLKVIEEYDEDFFVDTLKNTFVRQNLKPDFDIIKRAKTFKKLRENKKILMFISYDKNKKICFSLFGVLKDKAIYLHGGRSKDVKGDNSLAHNLFNSMVFLNKNFSVETLDLEGVNSPQRAFFKAGFGGELKPYYMINFKKK
tara:strand:+ start:622 stop:1614 length:993 start_codon:yes stop_codon:yes gene_type:complete